MRSNAEKTPLLPRRFGQTDESAETTRRVPRAIEGHWMGSGLQNSVLPRTGSSITQSGLRGKTEFCKPDPNAHALPDGAWERG